MYILRGEIAPFTVGSVVVRALDIFRTVLSDNELYVGGGVCCIGENGRFSKAEHESARQKPFPVGGMAIRETHALRMGNSGTVG